MIPEDMSEADHEAHEQSLDELYHTRARKDLLKIQLLRLTQKNSPGWVWHGDFTMQRGTILKKQWALREQFIQVMNEGADAGGMGAMNYGSFHTSHY